MAVSSFYVIIIKWPIGCATAESSLNGGKIGIDGIGVIPSAPQSLNNSNQNLF